MKIYGSRVFVRVPEVRRRSKWDNKSEIGILVGYNTNGYRVLVNNRVINTRHVQVVEERTKLICLESNESIASNRSYGSDSDLQDNNEVNVDNETIDSVSDDNDAYQSPLKENLTVQRKLTRKKSPVNRHGSPISHSIYVNYVKANVPSTYEESTNCRETEDPKKVMDSEVASLNKNNTWESVERPGNKMVNSITIIHSFIHLTSVKWVYRKETDGTYKARLVVQGYQPREHLENVYSPVGKMQTLKILLSSVVRMGYV